MKFTIVNQDQIPDDLPEGVYCCRLESMTWQEARVRFTGAVHTPGDCLIQVRKENPATQD